MINSLSPIEWLLFVTVGILTGVINTLAGSGSLVTLPILIFLCGLPPTAANGTNRIGAFLQSLVGAVALWREKKSVFHASQWVVAPAILGAILGAIAAVRASDQAMMLAIGLLMLVMFIVLLVDPVRWLRESEQDPTRMRHPVSWLIFAAIGFYGGFIQAGVGIFLLAGLVLAARYSLKDANAIKLSVTAALSIPSLLIFIWKNQIHFGFGITLAIFQVIGALLAVWLVKRVPNISLWIYRLLLLMVILSGLELVRRTVLSTIGSAE